MTLIGRSVSVILLVAGMAGAAENSPDTEDFIEAACKGDLQRVAVLYATSTNLDVNANAKDSGRTALTCAIENDRIDIVKTLAKLNGNQKVDFNKPDRTGADWLSLAVKSEYNFTSLLQAAAPATNFDTIQIQGKDVIEWPGWFNSNGDLIKGFVFLVPYLSAEHLNRRDQAGKSFLDRLFLSSGTLSDDTGIWSTTSTTTVLLTLLSREDIDLSYFESNRLNLLSPFFSWSKVDLNFGNKYLDFLIKHPRLSKITDSSAIDPATGRSMALAIYKNNQYSLVYFLTNFTPSSASLKTQDDTGLALCNYFIQDPKISDLVQKLNGLTDECASKYQSFKQLQLATVSLAHQPWRGGDRWDETYLTTAYDSARNRVVFLTDGGGYSYDLVVYDLSQNPAKLLYKKSEFKMKVPYKQLPTDIWWNPNIFLPEHCEFWILQNGDLLLHLREDRGETRDQIYYVDLNKGTEILIKENVGYHPQGFAAFGAYGDNSEKNVIYFGLMKSAQDQPLAISASERIFDVYCAGQSLCHFRSPNSVGDGQSIYQISLPNSALTKLTEVKGYRYHLNRVMPSTDVSKTWIASGAAGNSSGGLKSPLDLINYDSATAKYSVSHKLYNYGYGSVIYPGADKYIVKSSASDPRFPGLDFLNVLSGAADQESAVCNFPDSFYSIFYTPEERFSLDEHSVLGFDPRTQVITVLKGSSVLRFKCE
jgi:hypothetical protein